MFIYIGLYIELVVKRDSSRERHTPIAPLSLMLNMSDVFDKALRHEEHETTDQLSNTVSSNCILN